MHQAPLPVFVATVPTPLATPKVACPAPLANFGRPLAYSAHLHLLSADPITLSGRGCIRARGDRSLSLREAHPTPCCYRRIERSDPSGLPCNQRAHSAGSDSVIFGVDVDTPWIEALSPRAVRAASSPVAMAWSWLLYLNMPDRPIGQQVFELVQPMP